MANVPLGPEAHQIPPEAEAGPWALVLSGPGAEHISRDQMMELRQVAEQMSGGMAVFLTVVRGVNATRLIRPDPIPKPVPATKPDFRQFAVDNDYSDRMGYMAWNSVEFTYGECQRSYSRDILPPPRYLDGKYFGIDIPKSDPQGLDLLDLRSVQARLEASEYHPDAWVKGTRGNVGFLRHICEIKIPEAERDSVERIR